MPAPAAESRFPEPQIGEASFYSLEAEEALSKLGSSARGLASEEANRRLAELGPNQLPEEKPASTAALFLRQFQSPLIYLLFVAAAIALALREWGDGAVIVFVVFSNALIGSFQEGSAARSMAALRRFSSVKVRVARGEHEEVLDATQLVPGDVISVSAGDAIPADARLLEASNLETAEAALTGESMPVAKAEAVLPVETSLADRQNMLYAGTHVTAGRARALVVATGLRAEVGKIAQLTQHTGAAKTPLELRVEHLGKYLLLAGASVFFLILALGLQRGLPLPHILMVAISQLVSTVPEGLPVAMTIALAVGMQRMAKRGAIVRRLSAVESLGSTTVICSDKTGTLTRNEMTVTELVLASGRTLRISGSGYRPEGGLFEGERELRAGSDPAVTALCEAVALCNDAELLRGADDVVTGALGDPTEAALLTLAEKAGVRVSQLRAQKPRSGELPFDARSKLMATQHGRQIYIKGAPEAVAELCAYQSDERTALQESDRKRLQIAAQDMASRALRVLAVASVADASLEGGFAGLRERAVLLGLVGQMDPPRAEVAAAIQTCRRAGVRTVMVTGDHKITGLAIARSLGIAGPDARALDDKELSGLGDRELSQIVDRVAVFARVQPAQKLRIVNAFRARGEVVAMTGDGVNDAPALARADVGVAMGMTGTEVAKQASEIVLTDDNFASIVRAIEEGRVVYRNLKKVILVLLSSGLAELLVLLSAVAFGYPIPFLAVQILWNNVITEGTITANLTMDPAQGDEMRRPPIPKGEPLVTRPMVWRLAFLGVTITVVTLGFFGTCLASGMDLTRTRSATFTLLAVCEWFNVLNCRSETESALSLSVLRNRWLVGGLLLSNLLQVAVIYVPQLQRRFHTVPLTLGEALLIGGCGSLVLWVEEARKWLARAQASRRDTA